MGRLIYGEEKIRRNNLKMLRNKKVDFFMGDRESVESKVFEIIWWIPNIRIRERI